MQILICKWLIGDWQRLRGFDYFNPWPLWVKRKTLNLETSLQKWLFYKYIDYEFGQLEHVHKRSGLVFFYMINLERFLKSIVNTYSHYIIGKGFQDYSWIQGFEADFP